MSEPVSFVSPNTRTHMRRYTIRPRTEWKKEVEKLGFDFHTDPNGYPYWNESNCYELTDEMVVELNKGVNELHRMCIELVAKVVENDSMLESLIIPKEYWPLIKESWKKREPTLYGRFDLMYDGSSAPKLLEYNADTPTTIMEASVVQWEWKKAMLPQCSQYNTIHERLIETWKSLNIEGETHFASVSFSIEDYRTTMYMMDTAHQAGINGRYIKIEDVGWDNTAKCFVNENKVPIANIFKLYPYEWMVRETFGKHLTEQKVTRVVEPAWKMILSNKGILPLLWEMFPNHPNLVPAYFTQHESLGDTYVKKPIFGREGENITFQCKTESFWTTGLYGGEGYVYQQYCPVVDYGGRRPIVGGWVVGGKAAGIGIREDVSAITGNTSFFVPHIVREKEEAKVALPYQTTTCKLYQMQDLMMEQSHLELPFCAMKVPKICTIS